jgi:uncharacterized protein (DUF3084 family)
MTTTESYGCDKHGEDAYQGCAMCDLETLRERLHEAELVAASWKREAELNEQAANESSGYAKRLAEAEAYGKAQQRWAHEWRDKHDALTAENAALRKDAERYRWLRTQHANILRGPVHVAGVGALTSTGLDAAIDAHLAREGKP